MNEVGGWLVDVLSDAAVRFAALALIAELMTRRHRVTAPAHVHTIWRIVACAGALLPLVSAVAPAAVFVQPALAFDTIPGQITSADLLTAAAMVYIAGVAFLVARLILGLAAIARLRRQTRALSREDVKGIVERVTLQSRRAQHISFVESDTLAVPVTIGLRRPIVILPASWRSWEESRLTSVLVHEIAHVERADYLVGLGVAVLQAVWWWHPAAWITGARLSLTAELACDVRAGSTCGSAHYAGELVALAREAGNGRRRYGWTVGATSRLSARIEALLAAEKGARRDDRARLALVVVLLAILGTCAAASVRFTPIPHQGSVNAVDFAHLPRHVLRHQH